MHGNKKFSIAKTEGDTERVKQDHAFKCAAKLGKKHKLQLQKKPMARRKRSRQFMSADVEDMIEAGHIKSSFQIYNPHIGDQFVLHLLRKLSNDKLWHQPEETALQCVPRRFTSKADYVGKFEPLLFEECRAQLYSKWKELNETVSKDVYKVGINSVERKVRGWYNVIVYNVHGSKWMFMEGDIAVLSFGNPVAGETVVSENIIGTIRRLVDAPMAIIRIYVGSSGTNSKEEDCILQKFQLYRVWHLTVLGLPVTSQREYNALHQLHRLNYKMLQVILKPSQQSFPKYEKDPPAMPQLLTSSFVNHLHGSFNRPQLDAIKWVITCATAGINKEPKQHELWPFTLIQGPPGTGKTHTIWGMLNIIHLVHHKCYHTALLEKLGQRDYVIKVMDLVRGLPKSRILVCAPSNAATDELLARILDRGFIDGEINVYRPNVARVGIDSISPAAHAVSVERRTELLLGMGIEEILCWKDKLNNNKSQLEQKIDILKGKLNVISADCRSQNRVDFESDMFLLQNPNYDELLQNLAVVVGEWNKVQVEKSRLSILEDTFRFKRRSTLERARVELQASFAEEAEIVFTTLSSSGRKLLSRLTNGFDVVLIDEAAQASEVAVLSPLILGAAHCVLVGDHRQLPATVISDTAGKLLYGRSLFEKFQQMGCPTIMLSVQYRMHPQIRDFPSKYFYQGFLTDSEQVATLPDEIYYKDPLLRPYVFYDIAHGQESQGSGFVSYQNIHEANFCLLIYEHLQRTLKSSGATNVSVGIITPYKLQLKCLKREFAGVLNSEVGQDLYINTVDAFQGQECDVIMLSCVRASNHGVGFVGDIRRMNVALTRARRALWIMGNARSLMQSDDWAALISDAKSRNCYLNMDSLPKKFLYLKETKKLHFQ